MTTKNSKKTALTFFCEKCNFITSKKSNYNAHILTAKHKKTTLGLQKEAVALSCECGKIYSCRQNLFRHKIKCDKKSIFQPKYSHIEDETIMQPDINNVSMMLDLIKQNHDFKDLLNREDRRTKLPGVLKKFLMWDFEPQFDRRYVEERLGCIIYFREQK